MPVIEYLIHVNHKAFHLPKFQDEFLAAYGNDPSIKLEAIRVPPAVAQTYAANPAKDLLLRVSSPDAIVEAKVTAAVQRAVKSDAVQCVMNPVR